MPDAQRVAHQVWRHVAGHIANQFQTLGRGLVAHHIDHARQYLVQHKGVGLDAQLARLDAREIQDVVDDPHQVLTRLLDLGHIVVLAWREARLERQVRHADDGVHGRADLVAHVGQEIGLERGGLLGQFLGAAQILLDALAVADVHESADDALHLAARFAKTLQPIQRAVDHTIGIRQVHLAMHRLGALERHLHIVLEQLALVRLDEVTVQHGLAQVVLAANAKRGLVGAVEAQVAALRILVHDGDGDGVDEHLLELQLRRHTRLQLLVGVDVHVHAHHALGLALGVAQDACRAFIPMHGAIRTHHAPGVAEPGFAALQGSVQVCQRSRTVSAIQPLGPGGAPVIKHPLAQALVACLLADPDTAARAQVRIEHTDLSCLLRQLQALAGLLHGEFRAVHLGDILDDPHRCQRRARDLHRTGRNTRLERRSIESAQRPVLAHLLPRHQSRRHACRKGRMLLQAGKQRAHTFILHLLCSATHQRGKSGVEQANHPIGRQQHRRSVVEDRLLLLQQLAHALLTALQCLLLLQAFTQILVHAHHPDAHTETVEHGRQGGLCVVLGAVLAPVDESPLPRPPRHQVAPHVVVGLHTCLAAGQQAGFGALHLLQAVAGDGLKTGVHPFDEPFRVRHHHRHGTALQGRTEHLQALLAGGHALAVAQQRQHQQAEQQHQQPRGAPQEHPLRPGQQGRHVVQQHQRPRACRVVPIKAALLQRVRRAIDHHLRLPHIERQRRCHAVIKLAPKLPERSNPVDALLLQRWCHGIKPFAARAGDRHALRRQQQCGHAGTRKHGIDGRQRQLDHDHTQHRRRAAGSRVQWCGHIQSALVAESTHSRVHVAAPRKRLLEIGPEPHVLARGRLPCSGVGHDGSIGCDQVHTLCAKPVTRCAEQCQHSRSITPQLPQCRLLEQVRRQTHDRCRTQHLALGGVLDQ